MRFKNQKQGEPDMRWEKKYKGTVACRSKGLELSVVHIPSGANWKWFIYSHETTATSNAIIPHLAIAKKDCERVAKQLGILV